MTMPWKETEVMKLREEFVFKAMNGRASMSELCQEYGVSRKTGYKWLERFREHGLTGLCNASRRPHGSPNALSEAMVCKLIRLKMARPTWGPKKLINVYTRQYGEADAPSLSSVKRVLEKAGFVTHRRRARRGENARVEERVEAQTSNDLWTVDFKGWWKTRDGVRCEPLTIRDGYSRFLLDLRALESTSSDAVRPAFESLFEQYGLPGAIRSDNGSPFASVNAPLGLSRLSAWWVSLGIHLDRIAPGRPDQNGAHERIHKDIRAELQLSPANDAEESQALFDEWKRTFNWERPHEALNMKFPGEIYQRSEHAYEPGPLDISYAPNWMERRVSSAGTIKLLSNRIAISMALSGFTVGLQPEDRQLGVWFDYLRLGHIDLNTMKFISKTTNKRSRSSSGRSTARRRNGSEPTPTP
jgi:transposase InsO family protein